ncbi:glycogen/starch synthase [Luteolibacter sp. Y139]|uniref:starch synthase n=1 Tax=Luteolibacter soli TaxID=3135280 RepID=A0ABU9B523_9BACT
MLVVTPELNGSTALSKGGRIAPQVKAGGLADMATFLVDELSREVDVHVALPDFRRLAPIDGRKTSHRLHLCKGSEFTRRGRVYADERASELRAALAFQREIVHNVIPRVRPDIIHCNDWMTALVPAAARMMGIPSLFSLHGLRNEWCTLAEVEDRGLDLEPCWQNLFFSHYPKEYYERNRGTSLNFLATAVHASDYVNTVSEGFLKELVAGQVGTPEISGVLRQKLESGRASGILNAPCASYSPVTDPALPVTYDAAGHRAGKRENKLALQQATGLELDPEAPVFFWPSRLDPHQKGCQILAEILYRVVSDYWGLGAQFVFVADGPFYRHFRHIAEFHGLEHRIAVTPFKEGLSRLGYAGSDFCLMPSSFEPCGLAQMIALRYGSLPIVHRTGGLADTVRHIHGTSHVGNGFVFEHHDTKGLRWAIDEAIRFFLLPEHQRARDVSRVMRENTFSSGPTVQKYLEIYQTLCPRAGDVR